MDLQKLLEEPYACLPPVGSDIAELAEYYGVASSVIVEKLLFSRDLPLVGLTVTPGVKNNFKWIVGHSLSVQSEEDFGPRRKYTAMIVNKCASRYDVNSGRYMMSPSSRKFIDFMRACGLDAVSAKDIYVTGLLKTTALKQGASFPKKWIKQQSLLLVLEILLTKPDIILMLGRDVCNFFFNKMKVSSGEGRWHEFSLDTTNTVTGAVSAFTTATLAAPSPAIIDVEETPESLVRLASAAREFMRGFSARKDNKSVSLQVKSELRYPVLDNVDEVIRTFNEIAVNANRKLVSVDAEWQGRSPQNEGSFIRCIQFGWDRGKAVTIKLTDTAGRPTFSRDADSEPSLDSKYLLYQIIEQYFARFNLRPAGFFFQSDNEWLAYDGLDLLQFFTCPDTPEECRDSGGFGLDLAVLAYDELMSNELEMIRRFFTQVPDYYSQFDKRRVELASTVSKQTYDAGFGWIPDEVLLPYAGGDADVQISASLEFCERLLDKDGYGRNLWLPYWNSLKAEQAAAEIMRTGMPFNKQQALRLSKVYAKAVDERLVALSEAFNWPDFPIDTWQALNIALYGPRYSGYEDNSGNRQDRRPPGAKTLSLEPVIDNSKPPIAWSKIKSLGKEKQAKPSSSLKALGMLKYSDEVEHATVRDDGTTTISLIKPPPELGLLADTKILRQVQKNFLGKFEPFSGTSVQIAKRLEADDITAVCHDRRLIWSGGYPALVSDDGYLRCFISTVKETARWSASSPNLHNSPNKAEGLYAKILKDLYPGFVRTMFEAPDDYVIVETDLASAELFMLAMASGDTVLWDHCMRNLLPEHAPDFVDPHSKLCVDAFGLQCEPTKAGLESLDMLYIRNVGKCIAKDELIWTDRGPVKVQRLLNGKSMSIDVVPRAASIDGHTKIEAVECVGEKQCVTIVNSLGGELTVSNDHRSFIIDATGMISLIAAEDTKIGDQVLVYNYPTSSGAVCLIPGDVREAMSKLFLLHEVMSEKGDELSSIGCFLLSLVVNRAKVFSSQQLSIDVTRGLPKDKLSETVLRVASHLTKAVSHKISVSVDGKTGIIWLEGPKVSEYFGTLKATWPALPNLVLAMSRRLRLSYLSGLCVGACRGVRQGRCVVVDSSIVRQVRLLAQTCGLLLSESKTYDDVSVLSGFRQADFDAIGELSHCCDGVDKLLTPIEHEARFTRFAEYLDDELEDGCRRGLAARVGLRYRAKGDTRSAIRLMISELLEYVEKRNVSLADADLDFLELASAVLNSTRVQVATVTDVLDAGLHECFDVQTTDEQHHALVCGDGMLTHNSVFYGWAYGRQAEAVVMGAKELGLKVTLEEAKKLLDYLPKQYPNAGAYLEEAAARVDVGYLVMPMGRIRRAPKTQDRKQRSAYMREFKNAPIQGGVADVINNVAYNLVKLRREYRMRFHIMLQMHDAFYFLVHKSEVMRLCVDIIPKAIVDMVPIVPYSLSGVKSKAPPRYMGFNIAIMKRWKEKVKKDKYLAWLLDMGIDYSKIPRLEI